MPWESNVWSCYCLLCVNFPYWTEPELRLSGIQGPNREKEKREKERNELRDLVIALTCSWFFSSRNLGAMVLILFSSLYCLIRLGRTFMFWVSWKVLTLESTEILFFLEYWSRSGFSLPLDSFSIQASIYLLRWMNYVSLCFKRLSTVRMNLHSAT